MQIPRIYHDGPLAIGTSVELTPQAGNHVSRVLRLKPGSPVTMFNGRGGEYPATLHSIEKKSVVVHIDDFADISLESPLRVTLAQGISRGERMDYTIQKAVELGVSRIVPIATSRTVVNLRGERAEKRLEHWRAIIHSACEQCGRNYVPTLECITRIDSWLGQTLAGPGLLLDHRAEHAMGNLPAIQNVTLLIGPEGGLSEDERQSALKAGYQGIRMGPRVLRTETAALVALAALQTRMGDLG